MSPNERTFREQLEPHRRVLHAHCYRMLGSVQDAEDAVQETLLRAWRGLDEFEGRSSLRSWLYTIATNVCLRLIERRPARVLPIDYGPPADPHGPLGPPLVESTWIDPYPDAALRSDDPLAGPAARYEALEAVELAFIAALQHLPARQRAALILRDVLDFSARETANLLDTTEQSVASALKRARATLAREMPAAGQQPPAANSRVEQELLARLVQAFEDGDIEGIVTLLTDDA
jgi:RNA polymerase sigma-70 factor, ECF subfamily